MKKTLLYALLVLLPLMVNAYDFEVDGIYYYINSDGTSVSVTCKTTDYNSYSGSVVIPSTVIYNSKEYSVTNIPDAFYNCSGLTSVTIPNSVKSIGGGAFSGCSGLTSITIPNSVTSIGSLAFGYCYSLKSVTISVDTIGAGAFFDCYSLTSVTIGKSVKSIGLWAFGGCSGLTDLYCYAENVPTAMDAVFYDSSISFATLHVPASALDDYKVSEPWKNFSAIVAIAPTVVENLKVDENSAIANSTSIYDLQGRRLSQKPANGYYIRNGKKYFVKE